MRERFLVLLVAITMTASVAVSDTQEPQVPQTELQRFRHVVEQINAQAINAGTRLRHGAVSMGRGSSAAPTTPAQVCCGSNIDKIGKQFELLATSIRNLRACYQANGNTAAQVQMNFVYQDASSLFRAVGNFSNAKNDQDAQLGYGALARSLLLLRKSAEDLVECELPGAP